MTLNNRTILQKAEFAMSNLVAGGGQLLPVQSKKFMRLATTDTVLMSQCTLRPMNRTEEDINQIGFGSRILRPDTGFAPLPIAEHATPDLNRVRLHAKRFKGMVTVPEETLEENIEQGDLRQTLMQLIAPAAGRDLEEVIINGDSSSADPFLAQFDGILTQAQSQVVDAAGAGISDEILHDMMQMLPAKYKKNKRALRFYTAVNAEDQLRESRSNRATPMGDLYTETDKPIFSAGAPVSGVPLFPDNLGAGSDQTAIILTHPKNIVVGMRKKIQVRWKEQFDPSALLFKVTLQADVRFAEEEGVVKAVNLQL